MSEELIIPKAGKYGALRESHEPRLAAAEFLVDGVIPVSGYHAFDATHGIGAETNDPNNVTAPYAWGMDDNDRYGICGFAALDHYNVSKTGKVGLIGTFGTSKFPSLVAAYFAYGIAQGEPGPEPDQGVSNATVLAWAVQEGFIYGYAEVHPEYLDWFAKEFNGALLGLAIDGQVASDYFNRYPHRLPWNTMGTIDGHDTLYVKSQGTGPGTLVTWGGLQTFTESFRKTNVTDSWVVFDKYDPKVNWPALEAALAEVHGTDVPPAE
jgi:hypothetical protein